MSMRDASLYCDACQFVWLTNAAFDQLYAETERRFLPADLAALQADCEQRQHELSSQAFEKGAIVKYYDCAECNARMSRRAFAQTSGVIVNRCVEHGLLIAAQDLLHVIDFIRRGGEILTINNQVEDLEKELVQSVGRERDAEQRVQRGGAGGMPWFGLML
jgi:hypothetical protein